MSFRQMREIPQVNLTEEKVIHRLIESGQWLLAYNHAIKCAPKTISILYNLGLCFYRGEEYLEAIHYFSLTLTQVRGKMDASTLNLDLLQQKLLKAQDVEKYYLKPLNPIDIDDTALLTLRINLMLLTLYLKVHDIESIRKIITKYDYLKLDSIEKAKEYVK